MFNFEFYAFDFERVTYNGEEVDFVYRIVDGEAYVVFPDMTYEKLIPYVARGRSPKYVITIESKRYIAPLWLQDSL